MSVAVKVSWITLNRNLKLVASQCLARSVSQMATSAPPSQMEEIVKKFKLPKAYEGSRPSVWVEYIQLAMEYKPLNLGQGFPDYPPPEYITDALMQVASDGNLHQYTRGYGHPRLVQAIAKLYSKLIGRELNPQTEVLTTLGAYEALYAAITGHVDVGDEVIIIEPFFDCYEPMVRYAGGIPRFIALKPKSTDGTTLSSSDFVLDKTELESLFNQKTKAIILNTPNNPLGKVFTLEELTLIANLCKKHNVLCISDEVYEWMVYEPNKHIRIATLPGMWDRTITIGSAGKTFSVTGWKLGWAYGPSNLLFNIQMIHQNSVYTGCTPIQEATAIAFEKELGRLESDECYFNSITKELEPKKKYMATFLQETGFKPIVPEGGYFMMADWTPLEANVDLSSESDQYKDYRFTKWMTKNVGLQGIPPTAFYGVEHKPLGENFVRYCFIKCRYVLWGDFRRTSLFYTKEIDPPPYLDKMKFFEGMKMAATEHLIPQGKESKGCNHKQR
ncbi:kynurenine aminotransferase isoform X1 [Dendroctonus ponderosae]|uniref:Aminotransferase class I/classII large domain-containing protein n=1 Tax=Dendroctonus ponderosae TaxID=77166 RepID=A0AAR5NXR2_DENPD|nr:kynurenine aminotransferase isoform X1 [Dendroctonus ponderosae]XP_019753729.1 kynurenine aminotransferase isoform X1 [Dendroctonus ponderosae]